MTRKMLTATMVVAAMLLSILSLGGFTEVADAQGSPTCPYSLAIATADKAVTVKPCATSLAYPGPFTNMPTTPGGVYGWGSLNPVAGAGAATPAAPAAGGTGGGLAVTGSESAVLGYVGAGLVAFGAVALGSRRKFFQGALED